MNFDRKQIRDDLFRQMQTSIIGWYNPEGNLHYHLTEEDFRKHVEEIDLKARDYIRRNIHNPPNDIWISTKQLLDPLGRQNYAAEDQDVESHHVELDQEPSPENKMIDKYRIYYSDIHKNLKRFANLFMTEAYLYEFPLYDTDYLGYFRKQLYQNQLNIHISSRQLTDKDILGFEKGWKRLEKNRAGKLLRIIDSERIIENEKIEYTDKLLTYINELEENTLSNAEKPINKNIAGMKNNFDHCDIEAVYNHFKSGLVDKGYLSHEDLIEFIYYAFQKREIPKKKFVLKNARPKQKIRNIFGSFYREVAGGPHGKQLLYAALLGEYFEGYTTLNVSTNFS